MTGYRHRAFQDHAHTRMEYATVKGVLAQTTDKAILLTSDALPMPKWIPRHFLEPASKALIYRSSKGSTIEIQVQLPFALNEGLV